MEIAVPHAKTAFIDRSRTPREVLIVVTELSEHSPAGNEADARHDMLQAIARTVAEHNVSGGYEVRWGSNAARA